MVGQSKQIVELLKQMEQHTLPVVQLTPHATHAKFRWDSKLGGIPYWPKLLEYPCNGQGEPLYLIAQLNLEQLPSLPHYPQSGILQFFISNDDLWGLDLDASSHAEQGYHVVYHPLINEDEKQLRHDLPQANEQTELPLSREYRVTAQIQHELPSPSDYRFEQLIDCPWKLDEEVADYLFEHYCTTGTKIGGYAYFTQEDPRDSDDDDWLLLLQLDSHWKSDENIDIMWGDLGVANFFIRQADLRNLDFSHVWYNWDCS